VHICLITSRLGTRRCGVGDYTVRLAETFKLMNHRVTILSDLPSWGLIGMLRLWRELNRIKPDLVILQWVPFLYHRFGVNFWIPLCFFALRCRGYRLQIMVHEMWVPYTRAQYFVTGPLQRLSLLLLIVICHKTSVSIEAWTKQLRKLVPWKKAKIHWVPVGSTVPVAAQATRRDGSGILLVSINPMGSGKGPELLQKVWERIRQEPNLRLLVIGLTQDDAKKFFPALAEDKNCIFTGFLGHQELSAYLQGAAMLLAPFVDGVTGRRTSIMAGLEHGVPAITTRGFLMDEVFEKSPLVICRYDVDEFSAAVLELLRDPVRRQAMASASKAFYDQHFSWDRIANSLL